MFGSTSAQRGSSRGTTAQQKTVTGTLAIDGFTNPVGRQLRAPQLAQGEQILDDEAETVHANIKRVGLPKWDEADQTFARMLQKMMKAPERGLATEVRPIGAPTPAERNTGGGSDDIGDVSWNVPTVTLRYPSNIPLLPGHIKLVEGDSPEDMSLLAGVVGKLKARVIEQKY